MKVYLVKDGEWFLGIVWARNKDEAEWTWDQISDPSGCEFIPIDEAGCVALGSFHSGFAVYDIRSENTDTKGFTNMLLSCSVIEHFPDSIEDEDAA